MSLRSALITLAGLFPVSISQTTAPNPKMSVRASASQPSSCSGAMYWNVPRIAPCAVKFDGDVGSIDAPAPAMTDALTFARPASSSFAPLLVNITLPGFTSRCVMPA